MSTNRGTTDRDLNATQRSRKALQLRAQGLNLSEIALRLGYKDKSGVHHAISRELDRLAIDDANHLRGVELVRLDNLLEIFQVRAKTGDCRSAEIVLQTIALRCKILGLNIADRPAEERVKVIVRSIPAEWGDWPDPEPNAVDAANNHHQEGN